MAKQRCKDCSHLDVGIRNNNRNIFYCMHPGSIMETVPHRIISRSRETEIQTKTAPRWCPLREE